MANRICVVVFVPAGFSKDAMKTVNMYRNKTRYDPCPETAAIVNAKYQYVELSTLQ